jgi:signal transduction histidine kinase
MAIREELRMQVSEQALLAVARLIARNVPEETLFAAACEQVARVTGATSASLLRYAGDERAVAVGTWRADGKGGVPVNAELDFDHTNSALGRVRLTRRPARADTYEGVHGDLPAVMRAIGVRSAIAAPVLVGDDAWGALAASTTGDEPLAAGSEHGLVAFAELVALAVANAAEQRRVAAARVRLVEAGDATRCRLERELHEGAHQHVVALALKLRVARAHADADVAGLLDEALAEAMATNAALREMSRSLHPAVLVERGLAPALLALAARAAVPVHLRELPGRRFPAIVETTVYLLAAEAVAEAAARGAGEVGLRIADRGDHLLVKINDDGDDAPPRPALGELAERVAALGGAMEASGGFVCVTLPLAASTPAEPRRASA